MTKLMEFVKDHNAQVFLHVKGSLDVIFRDAYRKDQKVSHVIQAIWLHTYPEHQTNKKPRNEAQNLEQFDEH